MILVAALMKGATPEKRLAAFRSEVKALAEATGAMITAMSLAATAYMEQFGLLPD
jgi:hypothetical protein